MKPTVNFWPWFRFLITKFINISIPCYIRTPIKSLWFQHTSNTMLIPILCFELMCFKLCCAQTFHTKHSTFLHPLAQAAYKFNSVILVMFSYLNWITLVLLDRQMSRRVKNILFKEKKNQAISQEASEACGQVVFLPEIIKTRSRLHLDVVTFFKLTGRFRKKWMEVWGRLSVLCWTGGD